MNDKYVLVPVEPTPEIIAAAAIAVWPTASAADIAMGRDAAKIVLHSMAAIPGVTLDMLAATLATMAPAYRAMIAARPALPASDGDVPMPEPFGELDRFNVFHGFGHSEIEMTPVFSLNQLRAYGDARALAALATAGKTGSEQDAALLEALERIAGFTASQFFNQADFANECQIIARKAIATKEKV